MAIKFKAPLLGSKSPAGRFMNFFGYESSGMVLDFLNDQMLVRDAVNHNNNFFGQAKDILSYSAPSPKLTEQADGNLGFQAHNLYLNSAAPANQSITVLSGGSYAITITGSVSVTASGAATGTWTAGTTTFTAATATLTLGSTSGSGTVHVRRTPSVDTYIATTTAAAYDLPYVYSGGERTGIQVEPAATNLVTRSNDISNAAWTKTNGTVISGAFVTTSGKALNVSSILQDFTKAASATQYTLTADIEGQGLNRVTFRAQDSGGTVNSSTAVVSLSDGSVVSQTNAGTFSGAIASARLVRAGVWRVSLTFVSSADTFLRVVILPNDSVITTGDGVLGIKINLIQLETGTVATSPIITYGAAVARAADIPSMLGALFPLSSSEGTIFVEVVTPSSITASTDARPASLNDGTTSNRAFMYAGVGGLKFGVRSGGSNSADINAGSIAPSTTYKMAAAYAVNDFAASLNGGAVVTDASGAAPVGLNRLHIGHAGSSTHWNGPIKRIAYFPRRLSNAELQAITA